MTWYYAIGNERQGPVDDAELDRLIAARTVTPETLVWRAGMADWQPLAQARPQARPAPPPPPAPLPAPVPAPTPVAPHVTHPVPVASSTPVSTPTPAGSDPSTQPKFGGATFGTPGFGAPPGGAAAGGAGGAGSYGGSAARGAAETPDEILARVVGEGRSFGLGDVIGRAWEIVSANFGLAIGGTAMWLICQVLGAIPCLGILISLGVTPIVQAGVYRLILKLHRGEPAEFGDVFSTFSTSYLQLFLNTLVQLVIIGISIVPGYALIFIGNIMAQRSEGASLLLSLLGVLLILPPAIYLGVSWIFSAPLIIDKGLDFWPAMELSRKVVAKQFFGTFALLFLVGLIFLAGFIALCLGVFVSAPVALACIAVAYNELFDRT